MKQIRYTGNWKDEPIWREETAQETLNREKISEVAAKLYMGLDNFYTQRGYEDWLDKQSGVNE